MATTPSAPDALNTNLEKPQTSGNGSGQTLQYDSTAEIDPAKEHRSSTTKPTSKWGSWKKFRDGQKSDWWFASTAIPLLAATLSPLANVLSICALVTSWRETIYIDGNPVAEFDGVPFPDPKWCYWLNVASLVAGFLGNLFLLLNFTQRVRYLIALPATIILWYVSTGFLIGITACMEIYAPPSRPEETYSQGFWYAIAAAVFYLICSMILMVNMLGYFLGHYPDHFALTDAQRTLILQTMLFFIWLAGGGAVFSRIESDVGQDGWAFTDAVYFCDVTILTVGFGDLYPTTDLGRGIVFPYSVGGTIMLGLVISSLYKFMQQLGEENIVQKHVQRTRQRTLSRAVTNSFDLREREHAAHHLIRKRHPKGSAGAPKISGPTQARAYRTAMGNTVRRVTNPLTVPKPLRRKPRLILLREEKDRFDEMRRIQRQTNKFKKWYALIFSLAAFALLWCVGAVVFWQCEKNTQNMTYFQALYFCYVSLLTIGYGDLAPKSNAGRCFFVVWSLVAVPTMTILVSDLGDTVIAKFKKWSDDLADFTVLPKEGIWREFLDKNPWLLYWFQKWQAARAEKAAKKRVERGFDTVDPESVAEGNIDVEDADLALDLTLPTLATEAEQDISGHVPSLATLSRRIAVSIRKVAADLRFSPPKKYDYEEWVEFTRLIRFTKKSAGDRGEGVLEEEDEEGLVEWDWIGDDSPMMSGMCESEWILQRLTESLVRLERRREATARLEAVAEERSDCVPASDEDRVLASGADGPAS